MVNGASHRDYGIFPLAQREIFTTTGELPYSLNNRREIYSFFPDGNGVGIVWVKSSEAQSVKMHGISGIIVQNNV